jgi:hypothetical protein
MRSSMGLDSVGGITSIEFIAGLVSTLNWLIEETEGMPPKKRERYVNACHLLKQRLDWEFGDRNINTSEPHLNLDTLIADFTHFGMELDETCEFNSVSDKELNEWEEALNSLLQSISESSLPRHTRNALLDIATILRQAVRDLRRFGAAAANERLSDAVGRMVRSWNDVNATGGEAKKSWRTLWKIFVGLGKAAESAGKIASLPESVHKVLGS